MTLVRPLASCSSSAVCEEEEDEEWCEGRGDFLWHNKTCARLAFFVPGDEEEEENPPPPLLGEKDLVVIRTVV